MTVVRELRKFFEHMITAPTDTVQPDIDLASLALCRTDTPQEQSEDSAIPSVDGPSETGLGTIDGVQVAGPVLPATITPPDSVMGEDKDDAKSVSSMEAVNGDNPNNVPAPPARPPPVPPRPEATKASQEKTKIGILEESARQQDAAEVMGNIFDLISCAVQADAGPLREGEQMDTIKRLFFSDVTTVRNTAKGAEKLSELRHNYLVSPGWRDRHLYSTLDDDFGQNEMEDGTTRYEYIDHAAPILVINLRRIQWKNELVYDRSHVSLDKALYLDRYLGKTKSLQENQLLALREKQWETLRELRRVDAERKRLHQTEMEGMNLADSVEETSNFVQELMAHHSQEDMQEFSGIPTPPPELAEALHNKAESLKKDLEQMDLVSTLR